MPNTLSLLLSQYNNSLDNDLKKKDLISRIQTEANRLDPYLHSVPLILTEIFELEDINSRNIARAKIENIDTQDLKNLLATNEKLCYLQKSLAESLISLELNKQKIEDLFNQISTLLVQQTSALNESSIKRLSMPKYSVNIQEFSTQQIASYNDQINYEISTVAELRKSQPQENEIATIDDEIESQQKKDEIAGLSKQIIIHNIKKDLCASLQASNQIFKNLNSIRENHFQFLDKKAEHTIPTNPKPPSLWEKFIAFVSSLFVTKKPKVVPPASQKRNILAPFLTATISQPAAGEFVNVDLNDDSADKKIKVTPSEQKPLSASSFTKKETVATSRFSIFSKLRSFFKSDKTPKENPAPAKKNLFSRR